MTKARARKLLVEGGEDKRVIPHLVEKNGIPWERDGRPIVKIISFNGIPELLKRDVLEAELMAPDLEVAGILVDADEDCAARWIAIRNRCDNIFPELPGTLPVEGLIAENHDGKRLGVWIMPDNQSSGMTETFLHRLISDDEQPLLRYAEQCLTGSRQLGARWKETHHDKAVVHTWLAWQDPPGLQLHTAIVANRLHPQSESAAAFMKWFRELYQLETA